MRTVVSIVKSQGTPKKYSQYKSLVKKSIDLLGGIKKFVKPGGTVVIKPSILLPYPERAVCTDPSIVQAVAEIVKKESFAKRILVGDIPRIKLSSKDILKEAGIVAAVEKAGVEPYYMDEDEQIEVSIPNASIMSSTKLPRGVLEADSIIFIPKLKTHYISKMTAAIKAAHGLQATEDRGKFHRQDLNYKLVDLLRAIRPNLYVVDSILAMEGQGPVAGDLVKLNTIIAGYDPVAIDAVCAEMIGFEPLEVPTTRIAYHAGLGEADLKKIIIKGNKLSSVRRVFKRADPSIDGIHPKIETFIGGTCVGCLTSSRGFIDTIIKKGWLDKIDKLTVITGLDVSLGHEPTGEMVFILGDCAEKHKDKGIFIPGCIPFDSWSIGIEKLEKHLKRKGKLEAA